MKIKNPNLAGATLGLKSGPATGDENGVFDLDDADAAALLATPGWEPAKKGAKPPVAAVPDPEPDPDPPEPDTGQDEGDDPEEVDLEAMTKAELVALAEEQGISIDPYDRKIDIKTAIEEALTGADG